MGINMSGHYEVLCDVLTRRLTPKARDFVGGPKFRTGPEVPVLVVVVNERYPTKLTSSQSVRTWHS